MIKVELLKIGYRTPVIRDSPWYNKILAETTLGTAKQAGNARGAADLAWFSVHYAEKTGDQKLVDRIREEAETCQFQGYDPLENPAIKEAIEVKARVRDAVYVADLKKQAKTLEKMAEERLKLGPEFRRRALDYHEGAIEKAKKIEDSKLQEEIQASFKKKARKTSEE